MNRTDHISPLTDADRRLLRAIQSNANLTRQELADRCGMSGSTVWRRLNELKSAGIIRETVTLLDAERAGLPVCALLSVNLVSHDASVRANFDAFVMARDEIMQCFTVTGNFDYLLIVRAPSVQALEAVLMNEILGHETVASTSSQIALSQSKYTTALPL